jgi:hypothetical protein
VSEKRAASTAFKAQMAVVFGGTVINVATAILAPGAAVGRGIARAILPGTWVAQILVYLEGLERAISWFQELPAQYFYVLAHGAPDGPVKPPRPEWRQSFTAEPLPVAELSGAISGHRYYKRGRAVVLISCQVGQGNYPGELATAIGADVYASPDYVNAGLLTTPGRTSFPRLDWFVWSP